MRQIGEQWIENGRMYKAVANNQTCYMCRFAGDRLVCTASQEIQNGCDSGWNYCIKDLGPVDEEGCLAEERSGIYPEVEHVGKSWWVIVSTQDYDILARAPTRQEAIDLWNWRKV